MQFYTRYMTGIRSFYVYLNKENNSDEHIARIIRIPLVDYIAILKQFNAYQHFNGHQYFFKNKEDCDRAVQYLNDMYMVMLNLMYDEQQI